MAASEIQQGALALVYGSPSMDVNFNGGVNMTFATGLVLGDVSQVRTAKTVETENAAGVMVNVTTYDLGDEVTITMRPSGTTRALAAGINDLFPRPGGHATLISATDITHLDQALVTSTAGGISKATTGLVYGIKEATKASTPTGHVTWTIVLRRSEGITTWVPLA
jgi:hypothetical protein